MGLIQQFISSATEFVVLAPKVNKENREQIRSVVIKLASELDRGCITINLFLQGIRNCDDTNHLRYYLNNSRDKLLNMFNEFNICHGLYSLSDEYHQLFDSKKLSVDVRQFKNIDMLLGGLLSRERAIIDEVLDGLQELSAFVTSGSENVRDNMQEVFDKGDSIIATIEQKRKEVKEVARKIVDSM